MNISGNTIFIPGATSGIGLALALRLKTAGNTVIVGGRRSALLETLAADHGLDTETIDTTDPASVVAARDRVVARHPDLNVLVAMAGIMTPEDVRGADFLATAERVVDTNITGPLRLIAAFLGQLESRPDSTLMTVSSGLAHLPLGPFPTYNGSKAFIHRFSETIRLQLSGTSVKVVELVPPAVQTELVPGNSQNEHYMPLDAFADEVMAILEARPDVTEVLVERVGMLRFAEIEGRYPETVAAINGTA